MERNDSWSHRSVGASGFTRGTDESHDSNQSTPRWSSTRSTSLSRLHHQQSSPANTACAQAAHLVLKYGRELQIRFTNKEHPDKRFAPTGTAWDTLTTHKLRKLFGAVLAAEKEAAQGLRQDVPGLDDILDAIRPESGKRGKCNVLAIMLNSGCRFEDLVDFICRLSTPAMSNCHDENLPFTCGTLKKLFIDPELGTRFYCEQFPFSPYVFVEGKQPNNPIHVSSGLTLRLPIIVAATAVIGKGQRSIVERVKVERRGWIDANGKHNDEAIWVALKWFTHDTAFERYEASNAEYNILSKAAFSSTTHKNMTYALGTLVEGSDQQRQYGIFFPLAIMNLEQLLLLRPEDYRNLIDLKLEESTKFLKQLLALETQDRDHIFSIPTEDLKRKLEEDYTLESLLACASIHPLQISKLSFHEVAEIVFELCGQTCSSLGYFHHGIDDRARPQPFAHGDFRTANVLINLKGAKLADFGLARLKSTKSRESREWITLDQGDGTYVSPEFKLKGVSNDVSDLWSLGAVLMVMLTWLVGGPSLVKEFHVMRKGTDQFFIEHEDQALLNPLVIDWARKLTALSTSKDTGLGIVVDRLITILLSEYLEPDHETRKSLKLKAQNLAQEFFRCKDGIKKPTEALQGPTTTVKHDVLRKSCFFQGCKILPPDSVTVQCVAGDKIESSNMSLTQLIVSDSPHNFLCRVWPLKDGNLALKLSEPIQISLPNEWPIERVEQTSDGCHVTFISRNPIRRNEGRLFQCTMADLKNLATIRPIVDDDRKILVQLANRYTIHKSEPTPNFSSFCKVKTCETTSIGSDGALMVISSEFSAPRIFGWSRGATYKVRLNRLQDADISDPRTQIAGLRRVPCELLTHVLWTIDNCLLRVNETGLISKFYAGVKIVNVFTCSRGKHIVLLAYRIGSPDHVLWVWKINVCEIRPGAHLDMIGAFRAIQGDDVPISSSMTRGSSFRPYRIRIKTRNGHHMEGRFR